MMYIASNLMSARNALELYVWHLVIIEINSQSGSEFIIQNVVE